MRPMHRTLGLATTLILAGCSSPGWLSSPPNWLTPYRVDVAQGNFISESMAAQLQKGMGPEQVRAVLGTPLLIDPFRKDRWDYVFEIRRGDGQTERRRFSAFFENDQLVRWGGDPLPKESGEGILPSRPNR